MKVINKFEKFTLKLNQKIDNTTLLSLKNCGGQVAVTCTMNCQYSWARLSKIMEFEK